MDQVNPYRRILLSAEYLFDVKSFSEFETLFSYLPPAFQGKSEYRKTKNSVPIFSQMLYLHEHIYSKESIRVKKNPFK